jgi:ketosteroid isomerase-like protein
MADHPPPESVNARLQRAMSTHDLDALVGCFDAEYRSDQPAHPNRAFRSPEGVRKHWSWFFENVPDFHAELVRTAIQGDTEWAEWRWHGTQRDGTPFDVRGVVITGLRGGRIIWARLYMEPVEVRSADHYQSVTPAADA